MEPYSAYKDSDVEWLGEIPSHWRIMPLKELSSKEKYAFVDGPFGSDLKNEEYQNEGIPLIQLNNIGVGEHIIQNLKFITEEKANQLYKHNILPGNIVIAKMADPVARAAQVKDTFQRYVIVADCVKFVPNQNLILPKYLVYVLNSSQIKFCAELVSSGTTRLRVNLSSIKNIKILLPPYFEQYAIADFLDRETARIDTLIAKYQRLIELLEEERTSLISQAVTKGLDASAEMKNSSVEWLRELPRHWEIVPLKELSSKEKYAFVDGPFGSDLKNEEYQNEGVPLIQLNNIGVGEHIIQNLKFVTEEKANQLFKHNILPGNIVIAKMAEPVGRATIVKDLFPRYVIVADCVKFIPNPNLIFTKYLVYALNSPQIKSSAELASSGTTRLRINLSLIKKIKIALPPYFEQCVIVKYLDCKTSRIDTLKEKIKGMIAKLHEYRTSLISAVVTGKIDVR